MTQLVSTAGATTEPAATSARAPWTVTVVTAIVLVLAVVTSYGAIYFSFFFEDPDVGIGSWAFATGFIAINVVAAVAAVAMHRGSRLGWQLLVGYGLLGILWCIAKLVFWQELEASIFGIANIAGLLMLAAPRSRSHVR